ncbi:MAG TPA: hypothetical protein V6D28_21515 [Leptolyngbyaceae cyanobacterium]
MSTPKAQKIDLNTDYPCPCGRKGRLMPIALTDAFGCNRCQQIFVLEEKEQVIEQLSTTYPYKKAWLWTGSKWHRAHTRLRENYLPVSIGILLLELILALILAPYLPPDPKIIIIFTIVAVLLAVLPTLWQWLAYRR